MPGVVGAAPAPGEGLVVPRDTGLRVRAVGGVFRSRGFRAARRTTGAGRARGPAAAVIPRAIGPRGLLVGIHAPLDGAVRFVAGGLGAVAVAAAPPLRLPGVP